MSNLDEVRAELKDLGVNAVLEGEWTCPILELSALRTVLNNVDHHSVDGWRNLIPLLGRCAGPESSNGCAQEAFQAKFVPGGKVARVSNLTQAKECIGKGQI